MNTTKPKSEFERKVVELLKEIVPNQQMRLDDGEGHIYASTCKGTGQSSRTLILKDKKIIAKVFYDYESGKEEIFYTKR